MAPETTLPEDELSLPVAGPEITANSPTSESAGTGNHKEVSSARALEQNALSSIAAGSAGPVQGSLPSSSAASASATNPQFAEDGDLIEKEWVEKAKQIVEKTKDDPYVQSREINLVKTDYLKKRYNKDLEVSS